MWFIDKSNCERKKIDSRLFPIEFQQSQHNTTEQSKQITHRRFFRHILFESSIFGGA